jgi:TetR/AcrR family transcriptional regulator
MTAEIQKNDTDAGARERLLTAALALFNAKGYAATPVRELVAAAGVTKPVLYYYFGSKEGLYLGLMNGSFAQFEDSVSQVTTLQGPVTQRICHFCSTMLDTVVKNIEVMRLIYAIHYGPPQGAPYINFEAYFNRMLSTVQDLVREGIDSGELKPNDSADVTWTIISILNTAMAEQLCNVPARIDGQQMLRMLGLIMAGLATTQNGALPGATL